MGSAGRSMKPFYAALAGIAVVGGALIAARVMGGGGAPLTLQTAAPIALGPRGVVMGSDEAPVEIVEYSDFECPYCASFAVVQLPDVKARLVDAGRVRWRFVHYPLPQHVKAPYAHLASACASRQGRFWEMHDLIYQNHEEWVGSRRPEQVMERYAARLGLDLGGYRRCVEQREAWGDVLADKALGDSLGVAATPTFYVNGRPAPRNLSPTYDAFRRIVDSLAPPAAPAPAAGPQRR